MHRPYTQLIGLESKTLDPVCITTLLITITVVGEIAFFKSWSKGLRDRFFDDTRYVNRMWKNYGQKVLKPLFCVKVTAKVDRIEKNITTN